MNNQVQATGTVTSEELPEFLKRVNAEQVKDGEQVYVAETETERAAKQPAVQ